MEAKERLNKLAEVRYCFGDYFEVISMIKNTAISGVTWLNNRITCSRIASDDHVFFGMMSDPIEIDGWKVYEAGHDMTYFSDEKNDIVYYTMIH